MMSKCFYHLTSAPTHRVYESDNGELDFVGGKTCYALILTFLRVTLYPILWTSVNLKVSSWQMILFDNIYLYLFSTHI